MSERRPAVRVCDDMSPRRHTRTRVLAPCQPVDQDLAQLVLEARRGLTLATRAVEKLEARLRLQEDVQR